MNTIKLSFPWLVLFPATYLLHILEEYWAGEGFHRWIRRIARISLTPAQFLSINAVLWVAMDFAIFSVHSLSTEGSIVVALAVIVSVNGLGHLLGTLYTGSYSPGVATGLVFWVPLGIYALIRTAQVLSAALLWIGVAAGLMIQAIVSLLALILGRCNES
ncbi:MAG: HXXEE domain-containing protein [Candidatus Acidiferrales bacterium]